MKNKTCKNCKFWKNDHKAHLDILFFKSKNNDHLFVETFYDGKCLSNKSTFTPAQKSRLDWHSEDAELIKKEVVKLDYGSCKKEKNNLSESIKKVINKSCKDESQYRVIKSEFFYFDYEVFPQNMCTPNFGCTLFEELTK